MDNLPQLFGVDPVKTAAIAFLTGYLTDLLKIVLKVKGRGVLLLAFFVALFLSVLWIVPWKTHQETDALLAALKTALLTAVAAIGGGQLRSNLKDYFSGGGAGTQVPDTQAATPDTRPETPNA